ncbi:MAG: hypothetical protein HY537_05000, partial [Deltaproteobacteria bacterium]|nr:hypothetical protein [Deltaproteobacteria bacterium]
VLLSILILFRPAFLYPADFAFRAIKYDDSHEPQYRHHTESRAVLFAIQQAEHSVQRGNYTNAIQAIYEKILDKPDALVNTTNGWVSSQALARRFFRNLPLSVQRDFFFGSDAIYEIAARKQLQQAIERADAQAITAVAERHPFTPAGLEARLFLAFKYYNLGNVVLTLRHLDVLLEDKNWILSADPGVFTLGAFAATHAGQEQKLRFFLKLLEDRGTKNVLIGGRSFSFEKIRQFLLSQVKHPDPATFHFLSRPAPSGEIHISDIHYRSPIRMPDGTLSIQALACGPKFDSSAWPHHENSILRQNRENGGFVRDYPPIRGGKLILFGQGEKNLKKAHALAAKEDGITYAPISLSGDRVVFGKDDGNLVFLKSASGKLGEVGRCKLPLAPYELIVMANENLITWDASTLVSVNFDCSTLTTEELGPSIRGAVPLQTDKDSVVVYSHRAKETMTWVRATRDGKILAEAEMEVQSDTFLSPSVLLDDSVVFITRNNGQYKLFRARKLRQGGVEKMMEFPLDNPPTGPPIVTPDGRVLVPLDHGSALLLALDASGKLQEQGVYSVIPHMQFEGAASPDSSVIIGTAIGTGGEYTNSKLLFFFYLPLKAPKVAPFHWHLPFE